MAKTINLNVDIKAKYQEQLDKIKGIHSKLASAGGYDNHLGPERLNKFNALVKSLEQTLNLDNISFEQLTELKNNFKDLFNVLETVSKGVTTLTPEMKQLTDKLNQARQEVDDAAKIRDDIASHGKLSETGKSFVNLEGFNEKIAALGAYRLRKDNQTPYKTSLTDFANVYKRVKGGEKILTADGRDITTTKEWQDMIQELNQYNFQLKEANAVLKQKTKAEEIALQNLNNQVKIEKEQGITGVDITQDIAQTRSNVGNLTNQLYQQKAEQIGTEKTINTLTASIQKQQTALGKAFKQFTIYSLAMRGLKQAVNAAIQTIKELDKSLTEQAMVTGMSREQAYGLTKQYQDLALQVGATTKEIASVATEYMKQGKTIEDSLKLTEAAVAAAKVARVSVGDSVNYLTTALNGFRLSAEDAMRVSDKFAAVAAASATDYDELAIALSKVASQANLAGMSIDYTTALLTKGLETTREAPETMGTALKTIIARMRELSDYGETLEGDTDINNVESQLSYVGIALRNTNGELRSTEDVLDELGKKWDTLNTNQQAALAKALAGTRQQSRLIAMMDDYERVTELQEIAQRSAGATSAQAATYLEGIEASLNKVSVSWEKIVTSISDSEIITGGLNLFSKLLDVTDSILNHWLGMSVAIGGVVLATSGLIAKKIIENNIAKQTTELQQQQNLLALQKQKRAIEENIANQNGVELQAARVGLEQAEVELLKAQVRLEKARQTGDTSEIAKAEIELEAAKKIQQEQKTIYNDKLAQTQTLLAGNKEYESTVIQMAYAEQILNKSLLSGTRLLSIKVFIQNALNWADKIASIFTKKKTVATNTNTAAVNKNTKAQLANNAAQLANPIGAIIVLLITAAAAAIALYAVFRDRRTDSEKAAESIKKLSNEIYKMNESSTAIKKTISDFESLDNKIIKTKEDLEEMNDLLDAAAENIDFTKGGTVSEEDAEQAKNDYLAMTETQQINALRAEEERLALKMEEARRDQMAALSTLSEAERNSLLNKDTAVASAVFARNNTELYQEIDNLKEVNALTEEQAGLVEDLGERILSNLNAEEAYVWATEGKIDDLVEQLSALGSVNVAGKENKTASIIDVLTSEDYTLSEQIDAYSIAINQLDEETATLLKTEYKALDTMSQWGQTTIDMIEQLHLTAEEVNNISKAMAKIGVDSDTLDVRFQNLMNNMATSGQDIREAILTTFGDIIGDDEDKYNTILNAYAEATGTGILNMGQNLDKLHNTIDNFYKKAAEWSTMSKADQTQFLNDNAELFANNEDLLKAFESGNYQAIEEALKGNEALQKQVSDRITEIEQELRLELAKAKDDQNVAYIQMLENELAYLNDAEKLYEVSLETQLKQQEEQLNTYKEYLQEQKDALEDSLNKRKEAYEKYFDAINQNEEDEDYEEEANTLISNLSKLSSSTNADAKKQSKELENQLKELEEERLKTLRERAQEAVIENMDDTLDEINNKFDELINSNKALLAAMQGDLANGEGFLANLMTDKINDGATALELESFWKELESTYGSVLTGIDWDSFKASESSNSMFLNVNGQTIELSPGNQQSVYEVIMKALRQVGVS